jgi:hypothetical protein
VTGIIGRVGVLLFQPGQLGFQVAYPLVKTMQLGGQELVRPAGVAEESLRHDGSLPASPRVLRLPCQQAWLQTRCIACGGGMEMSTPSSSSLRGVCTPAHDSETSWPPPDAPREAVSARGWVVLQGVCIICHSLHSSTGGPHRRTTTM